MLILGCTQRECQISKDFVDDYRSMFESRISARDTEKLPDPEKSDAKNCSWSCDVEGHAEKCVERCCELANKNNSTTYTKSQLHALMIINSKKKK